MPLIDVLCANAHTSEVNRPLAMYPATPDCPTCGAVTEQVHLPPRLTWTLDPVVIFRAPDGTFRFPGDPNGTQTRRYEHEGMERIELRSAQDVRRFESHMNAHERRRAERRVERMCQIREDREHRSRSDLRNLMNGFSRFGRDVARAAMAQNDGKERPRVRDANFHVEAFSYDRSNREESRGSDGRRRRS